MIVLLLQLLFSYAKSINEFSLLNDSFYFALDKIYEINSTYNTSSIDAYTKCRDKVSGLIKGSEEDKTLLYELINNSGKSMSDLGLFHQCITSNNTYFLLEYNYTLEKLYKTLEGDDDQKRLISFLNSTTFFYGLCVIDECSAFVNTFFNDKNTSDYLSIEKFSVYKGGSYDEPTNKIVFYVLSIFLTVLLFIKLLTGLISFCCINKKGGKSSKSFDDSLLDDDSDSDESEEEEETDKDKANNLFQNGNKTKDQIAKIKQTEKISKLKQKVIRFFNINTNVQYLFSNKNIYYCQTNLNFIALLKTLLVFMLIYNHNFYSLIKIPVKDFNNSSFYKRIWLFLTKYSTFCINVFGALEGFEFAFKYMNYVKKEIEAQKELTIVKVLQFYLYSLPKVLSYLFIFFLFNYSIDAMYSLFSLSPMFQYFLSEINNRKCLNDLTYLLPFKMGYTDFNENNYNVCYKYANFFTNIHIAFIVSLIILTLSIKLKSKLFDAAIIIITVLNIAMSPISCTINDQSTFTIGFLFGETCSVKQPHLLFNDYFIGVFFGLMYFYYIDIVSSKPMTELISYTSFSLSFSSMKFIDSLSKCMKNTILIISILIQIALAVEYSIMIKINDQLDFPLTYAIKVLDIYCKRLFIISFMLMTIVVSLGDNYAIKYLYDSSIFTFVSRISFSFICTMDTSLYVFYTVYYVQLYLNYHNMLFMASGLMFVFGIANMIFTMLTELPIRMIMKEITMRAKTKEIRVDKVGPVVKEEKKEEDNSINK